MGIIVAKFGGTSVSTGSQLRHVREILQARSKRQYIVLSAPGKRFSEDQKITDLLLQAHLHPDDRSSLLCKVRERFIDIAAELNLPIGDLFDTLEEDVAHSVDLAISRGEYLCAKLFADYASLPFIDAKTLIHFDDKGNLLRHETDCSIREMAKRFPYAVIPGFYGSCTNGEIRTFSRGGSDITGALIAAALHADIYENWTDVDGLCSIDPVYCADAVCHSAVSYRQMKAIAASGTQLLHPCCLDPVCDMQIPTLIRNTFAPKKSGTYISDAIHENVPCICIRQNLKATALHHRLKTISGELFLGIDGEYIAEEDAAISASILTIFALPKEKLSQAIQITQPIGWLENESCIELLVPDPPNPKVLQKLHALLMS